MGTNWVPKAGAEPYGIQAALVLVTVLSISAVHPCRRAMALRVATVTVNFATSLLLMVFLTSVKIAATITAGTLG
jgi:hypothetical protein